jgi:hypothetical protein
MTSTTSTGPKAARSRRRAASWSSPTSPHNHHAAVMAVHRGAELAGTAQPDIYI